MKNQILGIYTRVSSKQQEDDGTSIDYQIKIGKKVSKQLGMKFELYNEGGKSSWDSNINTRPELVRLLKDIEKKKILSVWGWNMDRIGRNSESWWSILKILVGWRVNLFIGENVKPYDFKSPTDRLVVGILSLITTYDNELRRVRMTYGKMESLKRGQTFIGGTKPFGYDVDKNKNLVKHPFESEMVKTMFEMYRDGKNTTDIQMMLDSSEFEPRRSKTGWSLGSIQKILGNDIYRGEQEWTWKEINPDGSEVLIEEIKIKTPRVVSDELFYQSSKLKKRRSGHNQFDTDYHSLLKGFLYCSHCGMRMNHRMKKSELNDYYYCVYMERSWLKRDKSKYKPYERTGESCDMKKSLIMKQTDELVWDKFLQIFSESTWIKEEFKKKGLSPKGKMDSEVNKTIQSSRNQISLLRRKQTNVNDQIVQVELRMMNKEIKKPVYEGLVSNLNKTLEQVSNEIQDKLQEIDVLERRNNWIDWVGSMEKEINQMKEWTLEEKREKLEQFIKRIDVVYNEDKSEHDLKFIFSIPLVGDRLTYIDKKDKSKGYEIEGGENKIQITHRNQPTMSKDKLYLVKLITKYRMDDMSYTDISNKLNGDGVKTMRGKDWTKHSVGRFISYFSTNLNIVDIQPMKSPKKKR
jgi:site-specific DNA recombinase